MTGKIEGARGTRPASSPITIARAGGCPWSTCWQMRLQAHRADRAGSLHLSSARKAARGTWIDAGNAESEPAWIEGDCSF
ncbi:MAG: hypothetical protein ACLTBV_14300 [Enterocloster bolteae]